MHKCDSIQDNRGFSVVELLVIVGMLAVLAGFSIPMITSSVRDMQLIADARNISTSMTYARLSAASQMTRYQANFDVANSQWSISKLNRTTGNYEIQGSANTLGVGVANSHIAFKATTSPAPTGFPTTSAATITFNSRGIPIEGARAIYLSNQGFDYAITVSLTGKVQLMRYKNSVWTNQ